MAMFIAGLKVGENDMALEIHPDGIAALVYADHGAPSDILGPKALDDDRTVLRTLRPWADTLTAVHAHSGQRAEMERIHNEGLFEVTVDGEWTGADYYFEVKRSDGMIETYVDPYAFPPLLTDYDLYLLGEGRHLYSYEKLGAQLREVDGVKGVNFAVWAPNARRVSVIGNFNNWDSRVHPMNNRGGVGFWEIFIPGVTAGEVYKFSIRSNFRGYQAEKSDPYAFFGELRPRTGSIVADLSAYDWQDDAWMQSRAHNDYLHEPMSIYEVHLGSWRRHADGTWLTYRELADELVGYVKDLGFTHIELMPVSEHPFDGSWGYQVTGYYAVTSRYGTPEDFMYFIDTCHQNGIGVILDWVPAHFPKDGHALSYFDGTHLYSHEDPRRGEHPDWGTYIFNYGRNEVRNFLLSNALFWLDRYHIDGLRVDAVSSMLYLDFSREEGDWLPNEYGSNENLDAIGFVREFNEMVHAHFPGAVTVAEESTSWAMVSRPTFLGGLGFTLKWNMGWMHDTLEYIKRDPVYRRYHHNDITFSMLYAFTENFVLSLSHDEVVHLKGSLMTKMSGDWWQKFAGLRLLFGYQYTHPGKKLNFMGQEFGQWSEWSEARALDWYLVEQFKTHQQAQAWMRDLNHFYRSQPALFEHDFEPVGHRWINANDADNSVFSYIRFARDPNDFLVVLLNFTPRVLYNYRIGVPQAGRYREVLNSDSAHYGGSNVGNNGGVETLAEPWGEWKQSLNLTVPPLAIMILKPDQAGAESVG